MAESLVERIPLPNLRVYTAASVLAVAVAAYSALRETAERAEGPRNTTELIADTLVYLIEDPISIWAIINMAYCGVALVGWGVQCAVFGRLREAEVARLKDRLWNYVFYKFIFVFGVINAQFMDEVLLWAAWFTVLGSLYLLTQLCNDRLDYAGASSERGGAQAGLAATLGGAALGALAAGGAAASLLLPAAPPLAAFCLTECVLVMLCALQSLSRLFLAWRDADPADSAYYYTLLFFDLSVTVTEAADTLHMLCVCRLAPSLAALLLLLRLRALTARLAARAAAHRARAAAAHHVHHRYPLASSEEMCRNEDKCAICWQPMAEARKLPCLHLFHSGCLCRWVQQHASCPTCRRALPAPRRAHAARAAHAAHARPPLLQARAELGDVGDVGDVGGVGGVGPLLCVGVLLLVTYHLLVYNNATSRVVWWLPSLTADLPAPQMQGLFPDAHVETLLLGEDRAELSATPAAAPAPPASSVAPPVASVAPSASSVAPPRSDAHTSTSVEASTSTTFIRELEKRPLSVINRMCTTNPVFPKEASERERTLQLRKQALVEEARRKYLDKMATARKS